MFKSDHNRCVYFKKLLNDLFMYLLLYVDDMLIASKNMSRINSLNDQLSGKFEKKNLDATKKIFDMKLRSNQSIDKLYLS